MKSEYNTPLRPAIWMTGVLVWAFVVGTFLHVPTWAGIVLGSLTTASFLFYLGTYVHFLVNDPEALRREEIEGKREELLEAGVNIPERIVTDSAATVERQRHDP